MKDVFCKLYLYQRVRFFRQALLLNLLLIFFNQNYAQVISTSITTNTTVSVNSTCFGDCTIQPNVTLTIASAAIATFNGHITVSEGAKLIVDGATILMATGKKINIKGFSSLTGSLSIGGTMEIKNNSLISCATSGQFFRGIEVERATVKQRPYPAVGSRLFIENSTISNADYAVSNFDWDIGYVWDSCASSIVHGTDAMFLDSRYASLYLGQADTLHSKDSADVKMVRCTFTFSSSFLPNPPRMVYLFSSWYATFQNCTFEGKSTFPSGTVFTTGIEGYGSAVQVFPDAPGNPGSTFENLNIGINLYSYVDPDRIPSIYKAVFRCRYGVILSGVFSSEIVKNRSNGPLWGIYDDYNSFFLDNCPHYVIEGNHIQYDINNTYTGVRGIVVRNGGVSANQIYANTVGATNIDNRWEQIEAIQD